MIKPDRHWRWRRGVSNRSAAARADGAGASAGAPTRKQNKTKLKPSPPPPLSQAVDGSRRVASPYTLAFRTDAPNPTHLCARTLSLSEVASLRDAVLGDWYFQFLVDGLPVYGYLGKAVPPPADAPPGTPPTATLFTRLHFELAANGDRVVEATASADQASAVALPPPPAPGTAEAPLTLTFTYTVAWTESTTPPARRMDRYARETFLPHHLDVHWFSILNSGVTALLLTGFLATILARVLRADVRRYGAAGGLLVDGGELGSGGGGGGGSGSGSGFLHHQHSYGGGGAIAADEDDDAGWKALHADVFRFPPAKASFCAAIGTGAQLLAAASALFAASLFGAFRPHARGAVAAAGLGLYAATAGVAGYVGGSYYRQLGGRAWVRCTLATAGALGGPLFAVFCVNNSVALAYKVRFVFFCLGGRGFFFFFPRTRTPTSSTSPSSSVFARTRVRLPRSLTLLPPRLSLSPSHPVHGRPARLRHRLPGRPVGGGHPAADGRGRGRRQARPPGILCARPHRQVPARGVRMEGDGGVRGMRARARGHPFPPPHPASPLSPLPLLPLSHQIPPQPWWRGALPQVAAAGALPFSAIYIELYYVFLSVWGHKSFTVWPVLAALFAILLVVTAFVAVALTYFQLAAEDHRWWWRSFACGASTGAYVLAYAAYFYAAQTRMAGALQASFYFGYNAVAALGLALMLGFVGWRASLAFVRTINRAIKCD